MIRKIEKKLKVDLDEAVNLYNQAFEEDSKLDEAIAKSKQLILDYPSASEPYFILSLIALRLSDEGHAIEMCEAAHKLDPEIREYAEMLAALLTRTGQLADGLYYNKIALTLDPDKYLSPLMPKILKDFEKAVSMAAPSKHFIDGLTFFNETNYSNAIKELSAEIRLNADNYQAYLLLGRTLIIVERYPQAVAALQAAIQLSPDAGLPRAMLGRAHVYLGNFLQASTSAEDALKKEPTNPEVYAESMYTLLHCPNYSLEDAKNIANQFQTRFLEENPADETENFEKETDATPHIGLISNAFFSCDHSELFKSWFVFSPSKSLRLSGYQQSVISDNFTTTATTACNDWREIYDVDKFTLALTMQQDQLDCLVDLSSVAWPTRFELMAANPCPVRVGVFALPEPGFAPGVTHVLCDDIISLSADKFLLQGQKKITVDGTLFARSPYFILPQNIPLPAENNGFVTFGSVASLKHISPQCAMIWSNLLLKIPNSRLLLCGTSNTLRTVKQKICEYFADTGVIDRIVFPDETDNDEKTADPQIELAEAKIPIKVWKEIDIFLDTYPINCDAELCEALWTGTPVISLKSERRSSLSGASILNAAKRANWIAETPDEFVEIGEELGTNLKNLKTERQRLQKNVASSALFDPHSLALEIRRKLTSLITEKE